MKRRDLILGIGGLISAPIAVHAQPKLPTIGFLGPNRVGAFVQRLRELG